MQHRFCELVSENIKTLTALLKKRILNELQYMYIDEEITQDEMTEIIDKVDDFSDWLDDEVLYKNEDEETEDSEENDNVNDSENEDNDSDETGDEEDDETI